MEQKLPDLYYEMIREGNIVLSKYGIDITTIVDMYTDQKWRHYHTWHHIHDMLSYLKQTGNLSDELFLATVFHDAVYDPRKFDNEEKSVELFRSMFKGAEDKCETVVKMILETKHHQPTTYYSKLLCRADLNIFTKPFNEIIEYDKQIFREFQWVDFKEYKEKRIQVLLNLAEETREELTEISQNITLLASYVKSFQPKIGVFAGSFNPFHNGHKNILEKAEKVFDKVIVACGMNEDKGKVLSPEELQERLPKFLEYHQRERYRGMLHDFIAEFKKDYEVTLIRGLRSAKDLEYEQAMQSYLFDFSSEEINTTYFICDAFYSHLSSSAIRTLPSDLAKRYLPK